MPFYIRKQFIKCTLHSEPSIHGEPVIYRETLSDNDMTVGERITIRISEEQLRLIQDMIDSGRSESISDVIRAALEEYLSRFYSPENVRKLTVDLPKGSVMELESLIKDGDAVSIDDAIRDAVREYTRERTRMRLG